jgi:hypothetical protein
MGSITHTKLQNKNEKQTIKQTIWKRFIHKILVKKRLAGFFFQLYFLNKKL